HESFDSAPRALLLRVVFCPAGSVATVFGNPGAVVAPFVQVVSPGKKVSLTTQFWRSPLPVFVSFTSNESVLSGNCVQVLSTVRPAHWKLAESNAVATRFTFLSAEQK